MVQRQQFSKVIYGKYSSNYKSRPVKNRKLSILARPTVIGSVSMKLKIYITSISDLADGILHSIGLVAALEGVVIDVLILNL